ncbi:50S ribosomal protein L4 [Chloroflexota bacterium]
MQLPVYNLSGEMVRKIEVSDRLFAEPFNEAVVHQVMVALRANARQGTASAKTRAEVKGSTRKLFRQKGTGNARTGPAKSPLRRGGGVIFPPKPRDHRQGLPKKMRQLALRCMISEKARAESIKIIENLEIAEAKTKQMAAVLSAVGAGRSTLVVTAGPEEKVVRSARNLPKTKTTPVNIINVLDLLTYGSVVITEDAVRAAERIWAAGDEAKGGDDASL